MVIENNEIEAVNQDVVDPSDLSLEEIEALEKKEEGDPEPDKKEPDKPEPDKDVKDSPDTEEPTDKPDKAEPEPEKEIKADTDPKEVKRVEDLRRLTTKAQQEAAELRRKLQEVNNQLAESKKNSFQKLDDEEKDELKETDPDAYIEYVREEEKHENEIKAAETEQLEKLTEIQSGEVSNFILDRFGLEFDLSIPYDKQKDEIKALVDSGKLNKIDEYLDNNVKSQNGVYTASQMDDAYTVVFKDEIIADSKKNVREEVLGDIEKAAGGGSVLDKIPSDGASTRTGKKDPNDLNQEDIENLSEAECDQILASSE